MYDNTLFPSLFLMIVAKILVRFNLEFKAMLPYTNFNARVDKQSVAYVLEIIQEIDGWNQDEAEIYGVRAKILIDRDLILVSSYTVETYGKFSNSQQLEQITQSLRIFTALLQEFSNTAGLRTLL